MNSRKSGSRPPFTDGTCQSGKEVHVSPKALQLLELLVAERPRALAQTEIRATCCHLTEVELQIQNAVAFATERGMDRPARARVQGPRSLRSAV
jgi:hypothetical protein